MNHEEDFGITFITSFVIICYGFIIYLLLSTINIHVENILYISILTSFCIIIYDLSYRFCDKMYTLHLKRKNKNNEKNNETKKRSRSGMDDDISSEDSVSSEESDSEYDRLMKKNKLDDC